MFLRSYLLLGAFGIAAAAIGIVLPYRWLALPHSQIKKSETLEELIKRLNQLCVSLEQKKKGGAFIASSTTKTDFTLMGIIWSVHQSLAVINNIIVSEGDTISHFMVHKINQDTVELSSKEQGLLFLYLNQMPSSEH